MPSAMFTYLFPFPFPVSRFGIFLLRFFTHLSFKSGELIRDRRSPPVFQHPKPRLRVTALSPKSIYGCAPGQQPLPQPSPCCCQRAAGCSGPAQLSSVRHWGFSTSVNSSHEENQYFRLSFSTKHYPEIKS